MDWRVFLNPDKKNFDEGIHTNDDALQPITPEDSENRPIEQDSEKQRQKVCKKQDFYWCCKMEKTYQVHKTVSFGVFKF